MSTFSSADYPSTSRLLSLSLSYSSVWCLYTAHHFMPFTTIIPFSFSHSFIECSVSRPNASVITMCNRFLVVLQVCSHISCLSMVVSFIFYYTGAHTSPSPNFAQDQNLRLTVQSIYLLLTRLGRQGKERGRAAIDCPCRRRSLMRTCFNPRLFVSPLFSKWTWPPANSDFSLRALYAKCFQSIFCSLFFPTLQKTWRHRRRCCDVNVL